MKSEFEKSHTITQALHGSSELTECQIEQGNYSQKGLTMASKGQRINPYSISFSKSSTVDEFSTAYFRVELRRGTYGGAVWLWIRSTVRKGSNYQWGSTVKLSTPFGTVSKLPYGSGSNWDVNTRRCSPAICIGNPTSSFRVTYSGAASGSTATKTVQVV